MTGKLISQILIPLALMFVGLLGIRRAQRKGAMMVVGGMMLVLFGIGLPAILLITHINKPSWCEEIYTKNPRAASLPRDQFMQSCLKGSYTAIHCLIPRYVEANKTQCDANRAESDALLQ